MTIDGYQSSRFDRENLINSHIELVRRIAYKIHGRVSQYAEVDDLIQYGVIGLIEAANNYSNSKDGAFPNYASVRIKGEILDHLRRSSSLSRQNIKRNKLISSAKEQLRQNLGREPNTDEVAAKLGITPRDLLKWENLTAQGNIHSIEEFFHETSALFSSTDKGQDLLLDNKLKANILAEKLRELDKNQALILQLYFVEELNTYEIAQIMDLSPGRISQIKSAALNSLKDKLGSDFLISMAEFHTSSVIRAQITTIDYKIGLTSDVDSLYIRSRLINISAGTFEVILTRSTPNLGEKINEVIIEPEDTTIRAKLTIQEDKFTRLINSLHSEKRLNAVVEALIDATLTLSDQGDLIIDHLINTKITNFDFKRNFT